MAENQKVQPEQATSQDRMTGDRDEKNNDANTTTTSDSQQAPVSVEATDTKGDDEGSESEESTSDEVNPEGYRPRGKPSKPLASQSKPVKR